METATPFPYQPLQMAGCPPTCQRAAAWLPGDFPDQPARALVPCHGVRVNACTDLFFNYFEIQISTGVIALKYLCGTTMGNTS